MDKSRAGFWLRHIEDGFRCLPVTDHRMAVEGCPSLFGLTPEAVELLCETSDDREVQRELLLGAAMEDGWIRVRHHPSNGYVTFQFTADEPLPNLLLEAAYWYGQRMRFWPQDQILFSNLAHGTRRLAFGEVGRLRAQATNKPKAHPAGDEQEQASHRD